MKRPPAHVILVVLISLLASAYGPPSISPGTGDTARVTGAVVDEIRDAAPPELSATAAIVVDSGTGEVYFAKEPDEQLALASTTKIMTALVVAESLEPDQIVPITVDAAEYVDASLMGLRPGDRLTVEDLLYGLLLPSGNDAAVQLALALGGEAAFVDRMNERAAELGLRNTSFKNPHGLDAAGQYSSAADLAAMTRAALAIPLINTIVGTKTHVVVGTYRYELTNTNLLLYERSDVDGVKTGTTEAAGQMLVASATHGDQRIVIVVMHSTNRFVETSALIDYAFAEFADPAGRMPASPFYVGAGGTAWRVTGTPERLPAWQLELVRWELVEAPSAGSPGTMVLAIGAERVAELAVAP